ncbi:M13 family metallopeptidase [Emcibacter sp.]|uniref:M13 family metallopeptidase n=1 Tax=Emcibacter sp. TaxID=1979954 RepID=UPI002AA763E4|nr:M13-type metalloendopeptidase [Emcibacter sp.]
MKKYLGYTGLSLLLGSALLAGGCSPASETSEEQASLTSGVHAEHMKTDVRPGDDFFEYVNGTWLETTEIPADKSSIGSFYYLRDNAEDDVKAIIEEAAAADNAPGSDAQKVGDFYNSYLDMETRNARGIEPLAPEFAKIDAIASYDDLAAWFAYADKVGFDAPFGLYINNDAKQADQYAVYAWQSGLGLPDREYYFKDDEKSVETREKYVAHVERMLTLAGLDDAADKAKKIMALETALADKHWLKEDNRDSVKRYNKYERAQLSGLVADFDWDGYLKETGLADLDVLIINQPSYMEAMAGIIRDTDLETWKTWAKWSVINNVAGRLTEEIDQANFDFYGKVLSGTLEQRPMWRRAVTAVNGTLGEVVGKVYVDKHFKPEAKARMQELVANLVKAYEVSIRDLDWMGEETKQQALEKLHKFTPKIGYPDQWKDYEKLEIRADDYFGNVKRARIVEHDRELAKLGGPIQRWEWHMTPQTVNAYYNPTMNEIVFPAAILQPPFFDMAADDAVNYGAIGGVIGHEIGHGFDDKGSTYNGDGELQNWWTDADRAAFEERTGKLVAQYNGFEALPELNVNGEFTLGENIGDLGGLSIAYKAYKMSLDGKDAPVIDGFTGEQRFFIGWAQAFQGKYRDEALRTRIQTDPHSPASFRVNGVVRNVPAFYEAFGVGEDGGLYLTPEERVKIW